jgi:hypothetical protein
MNIDFYSFGKMVIESKIFQSDLIIYPETIEPSWWRKEGHLVQLEDLAAILAASPEVLIIGTGYMGLMKVPGELRKELLGRNIELYVEKSARAVEIFNSIHAKRKTVAAFHLTC